MSKFLDIKRTADEWRELTINVQNTMDGIVYNGLIALCGGNFDDVNRDDLSNFIKPRYEYGQTDFIQYIYDNKSGIVYILTNGNDVNDLIHLLNKQEQRTVELREQLKNAIVPKFKIGQDVYTYNKYQDCVYTLYLISIHIEQYETTEFNNLVYRARRLQDGFIGGYLEEEIFATKEEAEQRLKEIKGE